MLSIKYPLNWSVVEIAKINGTLFQSPKENVGAIVQRLSIETIDTINGSNLSTYVTELKNKLSGINILNSTSFNNPDGTIFQNLTYTYLKDGTNTKVMQLSKVYEDSKFTFTFFSPTEQFFQYVPIINTMSQSLKSTIFKDVFAIQSINYSKVSDIGVNSSLSNLMAENLSTEKNLDIDNSTNFQNENQSLTDITLFEYSNPYIGIKALYPSTFHKYETDNGMILTWNNGSSGFTLGQTPSMEMSIDDFSANQVIYLNETLDNFQIINYSISQIYEYPTQILMFSYNNNSVPYKSMMFITLDMDDAYLYTYFSPEQIFDDHLDAVIRILDSIELRNINKI
jgi:hypothetical protein